MKHLATNSTNLKDVMVLALGLALLASTLLVARAVAHGADILIKSDPADGVMLEQPPSQVVTWFETELESGSTLQVFNLEGNQNALRCYPFPEFTRQIEGEIDIVQ